MGNQNNILGPSGGIPAFRDGALFNNITANTNTQVKASSGVLQRVTVNTVGTTSSIALYDGMSAAVTITIASPAVVTWPVGQKPAAGSAVVFTNSGGELPTGFTAGTTYYVSTAGATATSAQMADTQAHALAGTNSIDTSGSQAGTQTAWNVSTPIGLFSTTTQGPLDIGAYFSEGLIAITAGGAAADQTVLYN